jgi:hypothetical protein
LEFCVSNVNLDRDFCLILSDFGAEGRAFIDTDLSEATFDQTVRDIADGNVDNVVAVVQFNPIKGQARDVTEEVARAVSDLAMHDGSYPRESVRTFLDAHGLAYPPSLEAKVFERWLVPARGKRKAAARAGASRTRKGGRKPAKKPPAKPAKARARAGAKPQKPKKPKARAGRTRK